MKKVPEQTEKTLEKRMLVLSRAAASVSAENEGPEGAGRMPGMNEDSKLSRIRIRRRRGKETAGKRQKRPRNRTKRRINGERPVLMLDGCMESCIGPSLEST